MKFTNRLETAICIATSAHQKQTRKGSAKPYIIHPYSVMCVASQYTDDEDILIACLFHDIIEDVPEEYSRDQMLKDYGERVVSIVDGVTKNESIKDWQGRADAYLHHLENEASDESVVVSCADKIHNLMSILADEKLVGDELWSRFNAGKERQQWWYHQVLAVTGKRLPDMNLNVQLAELVAELDKL
jgi:(p)ppGpp synthase/HD superfamily hydrolase